MIKRRQHIDRGIKTPLLGFGVILTGTLAFLVVLYLIIIITRIVIG